MTGKDYLGKWVLYNGVKYKCISYGQSGKRIILQPKLDTDRLFSVEFNEVILINEQQSN